MNLKTKIHFVISGVVICSSILFACDLQQLPANAYIVNSTNDSVEYACNTGYYNSFGQLQINCVNGVWIGLMPQCSAKICSNLTLGENMKSNAITAAFGEAVNLTCEVGYAFSVDLTNNPPVIDNLRSVACEDDPESVNGRWGAIPNCSIIDCGPKPSSNNMVTNDTGSSIFGTTIKYSCYSGYRDVTIYGAMATCNQNATWELYPSTARLNCLMEINFLNCRPNGTVTEIYAGDSSDGRCVSKCKNLQKRITAMTPTGCYCSDFWDENTTTVSVEQCNSTCSASNGITQPAFCGGNNHEQSVFLTRVGCYSDITLEQENITVQVSGDYKMTCKEYCLGLDSYYAILYQSNITNACVCTNETTQSAVLSLPHYCDSSIDIDGKEFGYINNLIKHSPSATDCTNLYSKGVRLNGIYGFLAGNGTSFKQYCKFKDGTQCDEGWIGYGGFCYYFHNDVMDFHSANSYCTSQNASLVSILNADEELFIEESLDAFPDYDSPSWYTGLYDHFAVSSFAWSDGMLLGYTDFTASEPSGQGHKCVKIRQYDGSWRWYDSNCTIPRAFICKKESVATQTKMFHCIQNLSSIQIDYSKTSGIMSLSLCIQTCRGQGMAYGLANGERCYCTNVLPSYTEYSWSTCDVGCVGHMYQMCGGNATDLFSLVVVDGYNRGASCEDLIVQGMSGSEFLLQTSNNPYFCNDTGCPYSWIKYGNGCYKFMTGTKTMDDAINWCSTYSSYLVSINDEEELSFLYQTINDVPPYSSDFHWYLTGVSVLADMTIRYASAQDYNSSMLFPMTGMSVFINSGGLEPGGIGKTSAFICEKTIHYTGCFQLSEDIWTFVIGNNVWMTVPTCIELCRANNFVYAGAHFTDCYCSSTCPNDKADGCYNTQYRYTKQLNGGESVLSVYNVDAFPVTANTCDDLFNKGVRINAVYNVTHGSVQCNFLDNTTCDIGWFGYRDKCYSYILDGGTIYDQVAACYNISATLLSIRDKDEHFFITNFLSGHERSAMTEIFLGVSDEFQAKSFTWTDGILTSYLPLNATDILNGVLVLHPGFNYTYKTDETYPELSAICQKQTGQCYENPGIIEPVITNFTSMDVTICKQLCMTNGSSQILIQETSCYCTNSTEQLIPSASNECSIPCPGNSLQICGGGGVVNSYEIDYKNVPASCDLIYEHGVFYKSSYLLVNKSNGTSYVKSSCGFTDETHCLKGWHGYLGYCYKFKPEIKRIQNAASFCEANGGHLLTPRSSKQVNFLNKILTDVPQFSTFSSWWTGIFGNFLSGYYLGADGIMLDNALGFGNTSTDNQVFTLFGSSTSQLYWTNDEKLPVVCEKSPGYIGCTTDIGATINASFNNQPWMTATQCIQLCLGQNATRAGIEYDSCYCGDVIIENITPEEGCEGCPGYFSQACGSSAGLLSVYDLSFYYNNIAVSCESLFENGVITPGWYYLFLSLDYPREYVQCFTYDSSLSPLSVPDGKIQTSSDLLQYTPDKSRISLPYSSESIWKPSGSDNDPWIKFKFIDDFIITGFINQGRPSTEVVEYVSEYTMQYYLKYWETYYHQIVASRDRIRRAFYYLPFPVVASKIRLYPKTWVGAPSVRVTILGQKFSDFDHSSLYLGCYGLFNESTFNNTWSFVNNSTYCKEVCSNLQQPFYTQDSGSGECLCGSNIGRYGKYEDWKCDENNTTGRITIYRSYDKHCPDLPDVSNTTKEGIYEHTSGVFTVNSIINYTCLEGHVFPDNTTTKLTTCQQNNTWTYTNITACNIINCPDVSIPQNGRVSTTQITYGTVVKLTCDIGHELPDSTKDRDLACQSNWAWNDTFSNCTAISCGVPPTVIKATVINGSDFTYNKTVTYYCNPLTYFPDNATNITVRCQEDGKWEDIPPHCAYPCSEAPPTKENSDMTLYHNAATYACNKFYKFDDDSAEKTLRCQSDNNWPLDNEACSVNEGMVFKKSAKFNFVGKKLRNYINSNTLLKSTQARSLSDCANDCLRNEQCDAYNFNKMEIENCRIFTNPTDESITLQQDGYWLYFEREELEFVGF